LPADSLVRQFPQEARTWGENPLLGEWGDAEARHDTARATSILAQVRSLGSALAAFNGERLLADAASAIDRAAGQPRDALAEGHRVYRDARLEFFRRNPGPAEAQFRRAARLFQQGASPMAQVAAYYAASAAFDQNRGEEARDELLRLRTSIDSRSHRALTAAIQGTLGLEANSAADWASGAREGHASSTLFRQLGETLNSALSDGIAAQALGFLGDNDAAWTARMRALSVVCALPDRSRCNGILNDAALTIASVGHGDSAIALTDASVDMQDTNPSLLALQFVKRARIATRANDAGRVRQSLASARTAAAGIRDASMRDMAESQIAVEEAVVRRAENPRASIAALDDAVIFVTERRAFHLLPNIFLQRARAFRAAGDDGAAAADYQRAMSEIETRRRMISDVNVRMSFLDIANEVIEESIDLELKRGAAAGAFEIANRRQAVDAAGPAPADVHRLPGGVAAIEYAVLPHTIVIFVVSKSGITADTVGVDRQVLSERVDSFVEKVRRRAPTAQIEQAGSILFGLLLAPVWHRLAPFNELVFVPDRQLYGVPFAALFDRASGRYLIEKFTIRFASTVAVSPQPAVSSALTPALVVADPSAPAKPSLRASRAEGERIAALYATDLLSGDDATPERFVAAARRSALIHYSGHADSDALSSGALLLAAHKGNIGLLGANAIARLTLESHPLVVLAGCGTFRGDAAHVGGMSSLARAFLLAGARGVVGTLWEIDDDVVAPLFLRFHERLRAGVSPAEALREAQIGMVRSADARFAHPATWSPIELVTDRSM
jgi:CHAT domain-containing protein